MQVVLKTTQSELKLKILNKKNVTFDMKGICSQTRLAVKLMHPKDDALIRLVS